MTIQDYILHLNAEPSPGILGKRRWGSDRLRQDRLAGGMQAHPGWGSQVDQTPLKVCLMSSCLAVPVCLKYWVPPLILKSRWPPGTLTGIKEVT